MTSKTLDSFIGKNGSVQPKPFVGTTEAQRVRVMNNPYQAAVARCVMRSTINSEDHRSDKKVFSFSDYSSITFEVTYTVVAYTAAGDD